MCPSFCDLASISDCPDGCGLGCVGLRPRSLLLFLLCVDRQIWLGDLHGGCTVGGADVFWFPSDIFPALVQLRYV